MYGERIVLRYNLGGVEYVLSQQLDMLANEMMDRGMYSEVHQLALQEMIRKVATHIVDTVGITWVEEMDWQYQDRLYKGQIGNRVREGTPSPYMRGFVGGGLRVS